MGGLGWALQSVASSRTCSEATSWRKADRASDRNSRCDSLSLHRPSLPQRDASRQHGPVTVMQDNLTKLMARLNSSVDWFIPAHLTSSPDILQGVRMFLFSHLFGPFLGHTISLSMLYIEGEADYSWWIFFIGVTAFWPFPFILRLTGWYVPLALISIENLMFCIFWGCYQYGGVSSPIMPWLVSVSP